MRNTKIKPNIHKQHDFEIDRSFSGNGGSNKNNNEYFNWDFDVNTFKLIGSELISDKFTAVIELVKNSYDANATEVKIDFVDAHDPVKGHIVIRDNGIGMSKNDISNKWMRIGTNSKRVREYSQEPFRRILLGEKGIGRFAIEKVASHIILKSKQKNDNTIHSLEIDWKEYEKHNKLDNPPLLTDIKNKYSSENTINIFKSDSGTVLTFKDLKESWTSTDISRLRRELAKLVSPMQEEYNNKNEFKIYVKETEKNLLLDVSEYKEIRNDSLNYASKVYKIDFDYSKNVQQELHFNDETKAIENIDSSIHQFGPIKMHIYFFNRNDKRKFKLAFKRNDLAIDGFKVYRDGVLATPFVEIASSEEGVDKYRDILGIDKRRWSNFFGKISSHDFIGLIEISKKHNPGIKDLTNRQDFEDTPEYKEFKKFIIEQLQQIEKELEIAKIEERKNKEVKLDVAVEEIKNVKKSLESLSKITTDDVKEQIKPMFKALQTVSKTVRQGSQEIKDLKSDLHKQEEVYFSLMSLQEYAADIAHMVRNSLDKIIGDAYYLKDELIGNELYEEANYIHTEMLKLNEDVNYMLKYAESGDELKEFDVAALIIKAFNAHKKKFENNDISIEIPKPETFNIIHNETMLRDIFNNLISNSIRSLNKGISIRKIIKCTAYKEDKNYIILFSDNGVGISEDIKVKIFDRYFTTNKDNGGSGLGLYIVRNNLKTFQGDIEIVDSEYKDQGCTFKITIPIKEEND